MSLRYLNPTSIAILVVVSLVAPGWAETITRQHDEMNRIRLQSTSTGTSEALTFDKNANLTSLAVSGTAVTSPSAPSNLAVSNIQSGSATYTWTDNASNESGFLIERRVEPSGLWTPLSAGANQTSFTDSGLTPSTTYRIRLSAQNAAGFSPSVEATFSTNAPAPLPNSLSFEAAGGNETFALAAGFAWSAYSDQQWLGTAIQTSGAGAQLQVTAAANPYLLARSGTVTVTRAGQTSTIAVTQSAVSTDYPTGLVATDGVYANKVHLTWTAISGADSYEVRRSTSSSFANATALGSATNPWFDDTTAIPGIAYYYWVRSWKTASGHSQPSNADFGYALVGPGFLDTSFVNQGIMTTSLGPFHHTLRGMAVQGDGRIVVACNYDNAGMIIRFLEDGAYDVSFGAQGIASLGQNAINDVVLQPDGKVVAVGASLYYLGGEAHDAFFVARLTAQGTLDPTFGTGGITTVRIPELAEAQCVAIQADGKIVVTGGYNPSINGRDDLATVRLTADGALDNTFSSDGIATLDFAPDDAKPSDIAIAPDGKIVVLEPVINFCRIEKRARGLRRPASACQSESRLGARSPERDA